MTDDIFAKMAEQLRPTDETREGLMRRIADAEAADAETNAVAVQPKSRASRRWVRWVAAAAAIVMVAGIAIGAQLLNTASPNGKGQDSAAEPGAGPVAADSSPETAADYAAVFAAVRKAAQNEPLVARTETAPSSSDQADGSAYGTNTQVAGIDEGDVVKSDGRTIFVAHGTEVVLVSAAGDESRVLARIDTTAGEAGPDRTENPQVVQGPVADLILDGSMLVVLVTEYVPQLGTITTNDPSVYVRYDALQTKALLYDVSDPSRPELVSSLGQSGSYTSSRLVGHLLYLVTTHVITDPAAVEAGDPRTFVPSVSDGASSAPLSPEDLSPVSGASGPIWTVVSSLNLQEGKRVDSTSVLCGAQSVYLTETNLFVAGPTGGAVATEDDTSLDPAEPLKTTLVRIALADGKVTPAAQGSVPGTVLNQYSMDEFEGHLRVAVTETGTTSSGRWFSRPALYVLDADLKVAGSLPELAKNETVQSVRFVGAVGYVVSFEQVDPLFALDLSDPSQPSVMSELKIPGFSSYLHPWSSDLLLGLGQQGNQSGVTPGLKLSMFDISDPYQVTEAVSVKVPFQDSEALYNAKAVFVDAKSGFVAFEATNWESEGSKPSYVIYRYADGKLTLVKKLKPSMPADGIGTRGLVVGDALYVASSVGVSVYQLDGFAELAVVTA